VLVRIQSWAREKRSTKVGLFSFIDVATAVFQRFYDSFRASFDSRLTAPTDARVPLKRWDKKVGPFLLTAVFPLSHAFFFTFQHFCITDRLSFCCRFQRA
jgi:hypothetical protein